MIIRELRKDYGRVEIEAMFQLCANLGLIDFVRVNNEEILYGRKLALRYRIPKGDAIHALVARRCGAVLITQDKDFYKLNHIVGIKKPQNLL